MPQLDISTYPSQIFWLIISFGILYACMHGLVVPRIRKIFQKRRSLLEEKLEKIESFREEIEELEKKIDLLCNQAQKDAIEMLKASQKECDRLFEEEEAKLQKKTFESLEKFNQEIKDRVEKIDEELSKKQGDLSDLIVQKILCHSSATSSKERTS